MGNNNIQINQFVQMRRLNNSIQQKSNKIPKKYKEKNICTNTLCFLIIFATFFALIESQISIDYEIYKNPLIQSRNIQLYAQTTAIYSTTFLFDRALPSIPQPQRTFVSYLSLNFFCNVLNSAGYYQMYLQILPINFNSQTSLVLKVGNTPNNLKRLQFSVLIFANQYQNVDYVDFAQLMLYIGSIENIYLQYPDPIIVPHFQYIQFQSYSNWWEFVPSITNVTNLYLQVRPRFLGTYIVAQCRIKYLILYKDQMPPIIKPQIITYFQSQMPTTNITIKRFLYGFQITKSAILFGIYYFAYTLNTISVRGIYATESYYPPIQYRIDLDNQFRRFNYQYIIINSYGCPNISFPFRNYNSTAGKYQCIDICPIGTYSTYVNSYNSLACMNCPSSCTACSDQFVCSQCIIGYQLLQDFSCALKSSYFMINGTIKICNSTLNNCTDCISNGTVCSDCVAGYAINATTGRCLKCSIIFANCKYCTYDVCIVCYQNSTMITSDECGVPPPLPSPPPVPNCLQTQCEQCTFADLNICLKCINSTQILLIRGVCKYFVCGDGKKDINQTCDDGNTFDYDGCSSNCLQIQRGFYCNNIRVYFNQSFPLVSNCYYTKAIPLKLLYIKKVLNQNKIMIALNNSFPYIRKWKQLSQQNLTSLMQFQIGSNTSKIYDYSIKTYFSSKQISKNPLTTRRMLQISNNFSPYNYQQINLQITYFKTSQTSLSLNNQPMSIVFSPYFSNLSVFRFSNTSSSINFPLTADNKHLLQYYDEYVYQHAKLIFLLSLILSICLILMVIFSVIIYFIENNNSKQMLISLQTAFVVQFAYFSMLQIGELNPLFSALLQGLRYSNGFNFSSVLQTNEFSLNKSINGIQISSSHFVNNFNISLIAILIPLIVAGIIALYIKIKSRSSQPSSKKNYENTKQINPTDNNLNSSSKNQTQPFYKLNLLVNVLIGNFSFSLLLFFLYNFLFNIFLQFTVFISTLTTLDMIVALSILAILVVYVILLLLKPEVFSTLTQKIKRISNDSYRNRKKLLKNIKNKRQQFLQCQQFQYQQNSPSIFQKINVKLFYLLFIIIIHLINSLSIILLSDKVIFWNLIPIILYLFQILFLQKSSFYDPANKLRYIFNCLVGISIQIIYMIRHILVSQKENTEGGQESNIGIYFPYSILILLYCLTVNAIVYFVYSIKKIRCCQLSIQWYDKNELRQKFNNAKNNIRIQKIHEKINNCHNPQEFIQKMKQQKSLKQFKNELNTHKQPALQQIQTIYNEHIQSHTQNINYQKPISPNRKILKHLQKSQYLSQEVDDDQVRFKQDLDIYLRTKIRMHDDSDQQNKKNHKQCEIYGKNEDQQDQIKYQENNLQPNSLQKHRIMKKFIKQTIKNLNINRQKQKKKLIKYLENQSMPYNYTNQSKYEVFDQYDKI